MKTIHSVPGQGRKPANFRNIACHSRRATIHLDLDLDSKGPRPTTTSTSQRIRPASQSSLSISHTHTHTPPTSAPCHCVPKFLAISLSPPTPHLTDRSIYCPRPACALERCVADRPSRRGGIRRLPRVGRTTGPSTACAASMTRRR